MPEIVLSDLNMPGMSGFELLSVVRRRFPGLKVVAMSSAFGSESIPTGVAADAFYEKATGVDLLLASITRVQRAEAVSAKLRDTATPMWVPVPPSPAERKPYILISCPECLRIFPKPFGSSTFVVHKACCVFCFSPVHYALIEDAHLPSLPFDPSHSD